MPPYKRERRVLPDYVTIGSGSRLWTARKVAFVDDGGPARIVETSKSH